VLPIFENKCLSCHNEQRAKGGLVMSSFASLFKPGDGGTPPISADSVEKSEILKRVLLPEAHDDHMPPEGKVPMTKDEIELLRFWITNGANQELMATELKKQGAENVFQNVNADLSRYRMRNQISQINAEKIKADLDQLAEQIRAVVRKDETGETDQYILTMKFPPSEFDDESIKRLRPYFDEFSKLSLTSTKIDDEGLYYIGQMPNVKKLFLQKTSIDGSGLVHLQKLKNLEVLNLSFTNVDDKSALDLLKIPNLKEVYLYRTKTSKEVAEALEKYKQGLRVLLEEGPYN